MMKRFAQISIVFLFTALRAGAQSSQQEPGTHDMGNHDMGNMDPRNSQGMMRLMDEMHPKTFVQEIEHHASSGTSAEPN